MLSIILAVALVAASPGVPMPFPSIPPTIPDIVTEVATAHHLDPALVWAIVWRESLNTPGHITLNDGGGVSGSYGLMQVNLATVHAMGGQWRTIDPERLFDPRTNLECGCLILRWRLYEVLEHRGWVVPWDGARPDYRGMAVALKYLDAAHRRDIFAHAAAAYTCGNVAVEQWPTLLDMAPDKAAVKQAYVADVMRFYDLVQGVTP